MLIKYQFQHRVWREKNHFQVQNSERVSMKEVAGIGGHHTIEYE